MSNEHTENEARISGSGLNAGLGVWVSVNDHLPPFNKYVACINVDSIENTDGAFDTCVHQCAYLSNFGEGIHKFWSVYGQRGMCLDAFTHWCHLPETPNV